MPLLTSVPRGLPYQKSLTTRIMFGQSFTRLVLAVSFLAIPYVSLVSAATSPAQRPDPEASAEVTSANLKFCPGSGLPCSEVSPEALERGRKEFVKSCGFCHGPAATGGEGPNLIRSTLVRHDKNGDLIGPVIRNGRPEKGMPALSLPDPTIAEIITFLKVRIAASDKTSAERMGHDYSAAKLLTGNAEAGKAFFYGAGGCGKCHSPDKDLAGIADRYSAIDLEARFLYPAGERATATVIDASGKEWRGQVLEMDDSDVAIKDSSGWYHSWSRSAIKLEISDPLAAHRELLSKYTSTDVHNVLAYLESLK